MPKYSHNYTYLHVYTVWPTTIPIHHQGELIGLQDTRIFWTERYVMEHGVW